MGKYLSHRVRHQQSVAELFTSRTGSWSDCYVLVQTEDGQDSLRTVPEEWLSSVQVAGERSRVTRLITLIRHRSMMEGAVERLGTYIADQVRHHAPDWGEVSTVRLVRAHWPTSIPEMTHPKGGWKLPPIGEVASSRKTTIVTIKLQHGRATSVQWPTPRAPRL